MTTNNANNLKRVSQAIIFLDNVLLSMGDSYCDIVSNLCDMSGLDFDYDIAFKDKNYTDNLAQKCYERILKKNKTWIKEIVAYYEEMKDFLRMNICEYRPRKSDWQTDFEKELKNDENPVQAAIVVIASFVETLNDKKLFCRINKIKDYLMDVDLNIVYLGNDIGNNLYRYLNTEVFFASNCSYAVGHIICKDDLFFNENSKNQYVCHAELKNSLALKKEEGYSIVFGKEHSNIIVRIYKDIVKVNEFIVEHFIGDMCYEKVLNNETIEELCSLLSEVLNNLAKEHFKA